MGDHLGGYRAVLALCVEASHARGMGHLFRGLALAQALESQGARLGFYMNSFAPAEALLRDRGRSFTTVSLDDSGWASGIIRKDGITAWLNDRLDTGAGHAADVKQAGAHLVTFDDRGPGAAQADLNIVAFPANDDEKLPGRRVLSGPQSLVLDPAIAGFRRPRTELNSLVVSMGGSDTYGVTVDVARALKDRGQSATLILGPGFAHDAALAAVKHDGLAVKRNVPSLAQEFSHHDLAITAGGVTPCEANAAGLPCIVIATESWEARTGHVLEQLGGSRFVGSRDRIDFSFLDQPLPIAAMSEAAMRGVPCDGAATIAREILAL
jgi:spore coat polysaccharide biosynthesis predicted glycosyltransferase SpsG